MAVLTWDQTGERIFETGVDRGVLFVQGPTGTYGEGVPWNGLISVTESPTGAEANPQYADNQKYLNLTSAEEFEGTIEAFTYPDEFMACEGSVDLAPGVSIGQQRRSQFALCYRTKIGNDVNGQDHGYKIHIIYGAMAAPSEKAYTTINDSPEATTFSWELTTTPVPVTGHAPTATITVNSLTVAAADLAAFEALIYGAAATESELPMPDEIDALFTTP